MRNSDWTIEKTNKLDPDRAREGPQRTRKERDLMRREDRKRGTDGSETDVTDADILSPFL